MLWFVLAIVVLAVGASFHPMVRNVARALRPSTAVDSVPPEVPSLTEPAILAFSKTNGFRHDEAIAAGIPALARIAAKNGWSMFHTENGAVFDTAALESVRVLVWLCASGAPLSESQRAAVQAWIERGGGFVGIHAALDDSHASWEWYQRSIIGMDFTGHPLEHSTVNILLERPDHPAMRGLPKVWGRKDEWYSWDRSVRGQNGVEVLATLDESMYEPRLQLLWIDADLRMGDHPVVWTRPVGQGRAFLSALGHTGTSYSEPEHLSLLEGGIAWAGGLDIRAESAENAEP